MEPSDSFFNLRTASTASLSIVVLFHGELLSDFENTTFGRLFIPSATFGMSCFALGVGQ